MNLKFGFPVEISDKAELAAATKIEGGAAAASSLERSALQKLSIALASAPWMRLQLKLRSVYSIMTRKSNPTLHYSGFDVT